MALEDSNYIPMNIESTRLRRAFDEAYNQAVTCQKNQDSINPLNRTKHIHGASVLQGNRVIGSGYNKYDRNYVQGRFYLSLHAELAAILDSSIPPIYRGLLSHSFPNKVNKQRKSPTRRNNHKNFPKKVIKNYRSNSFELLVLRINSNGQLKNSRPCAICIEDMRRHQIKRVFYTDDNGNIVSENIPEMVPSPDIRPFVLQNHIH